MRTRGYTSIPLRRYYGRILLKKYKIKLRNKNTGLAGAEGGDVFHGRRGCVGLALAPRVAVESAVAPSAGRVAHAIATVERGADFLDEKRNKKRKKRNEGVWNCLLGDTRRSIIGPSEPKEISEY